MENEAIERIQNELRSMIDNAIKNTILFMVKELRPELNPQAVLKDLEERARHESRSA